MQLENSNREKRRAIKIIIRIYLTNLWSSDMKILWCNKS